MRFLLSIVPPRSNQLIRIALSLCITTGTAGLLHHAVAQATRTPASNSCIVQRVTSLPGTHHFAGDFMEAVATDSAQNSTQIWGLTADLSSEVPRPARAMYISRSADGGRTWVQVARIDSRYFNAGIGEGLRNGFFVAPDATYFVITTQRGAFQVIPQSGTREQQVIAINGPRVPSSAPKVRIPKKAGEPVRANVVAMTSDHSHLIVGYGYFDLSPLLFLYRQSAAGSWILEKQLPSLPTDMDILSMQIDDADKSRPALLYVGTGDQVYVLDLQTGRWKRIEGVGPDSAIHGMTLVGGLHLAACWGVYNPAANGTVQRVTDARFLLHRFSDEAGPNLRAYSIEVDPSSHNREVVTSISGVYTSLDSGRTWKRFNDLPGGEFRTAHINPDGTVLVSGMTGTFLINPFADGCSPHLRSRSR